MNQTMLQTGSEKITRDLWMAKATQALVAKVELDVFTHINTGKRTLKEIARASQSSECGIRPLLDARTGPPLPLLFDLNMLVHTEQGGVFTMKEYRAWLKEAGFKKVTTIKAPSPSPLILATK